MSALEPPMAPTASPSSRTVPGAAGRRRWARLVLTILLAAAMVGWAAGCSRETDAGTLGREGDGEVSDHADDDGGISGEDRGLDDGDAGDDDAADTGEGPGASDDHAGDGAPAEAALEPPPPGVALHPGVYRYRVNASGEDGDRTREWVLRVRNAPESAEKAQVLAYEGEGSPFSHEIVWRDDGLVVRALMQAQGRCVWEPAVVRYRVPYEPGARWRTESRCESASSESDAVTTVQEEVSVVEHRTTRIAGQVVEVVVLRRNEELRVRSAELGLEFVAHAVTTEEFSPAHGLVVRFEGQIRRTSHSGGFTERALTGEVLSLEPAIG